MNWKTIHFLSFLGLAMALATVTFLPGTIEPFIWPIVLVISAYILAKNVSQKLLLHGLVLGMYNCAFVTGIHLLFRDEYVNLNPKMGAFLEKPIIENHPGLSMLLTGVFIGIVSGLIIGILATIIRKNILNKQKK